jgi:hypothetical protein
MGQHPSDTYSDPDNPDADRGDCDSDRRHMFNMTAVAETPQFSNPTLRTLASGWRFAGIYSRSSGRPLTILAGSDRALNGLGVNAQGQSTQRASQVLSNPYGDKSGRPLTSYLNPAAFAQPAPGTLGNARRNSVTGPPIWSFDVAVSRVFHVSAEQRMEFRAEAFNVTNSFRAGDPAGVLPVNTTLNNANFGLVRSALAPRILQFALKYLF